MSVSNGENTIDQFEKTLNSTDNMKNAMRSNLLYLKIAKSVTFTYSLSMFQDEKATNSKRMPINCLCLRALLTAKKKICIYFRRLQKRSNF